MATRSIFFYRNESGKLVGKTCHWSGHPNNMLPVLQRIHKAWGNSLEATTTNLIADTSFHWCEIYNWDGAKENIKPFKDSFITDSKEAYEQGKPYAFAYTEKWVLASWDYFGFLFYSDYIYILSDAGITVLDGKEKVELDGKTGYALLGFVRWDEDIEQSTYFERGNKKHNLGYYYE